MELGGKFLACFITLALVGVSLAEEEPESVVVRGRVESCSGWRLNRMPEVKAFIKEDLPMYHDLEFKAKPGANPDLLLLNEDDGIIERIDLAKFDREGCNELVADLGFYRKNYKDEEVPEEKQGPYRTREDLTHEEL